MIIVISALGREDMGREAFVAGAKSFIIKPFVEEKQISLGSISSTINKILQEK